MLVVTIGLSLPIVGVYARSAHAEDPTTAASVAAPVATGSSSASVEGAAVAREAEGPAKKSGPVVDASRLRPHVTTIAERVRSGFGVIALLALCFAISRDRRRIDWRLVAIGTALQIVFALLILGSPVGRAVFKGANDGVVALLDYSKEGSKFLFASYLTGKLEPALINFAFNVLPSIVFFSSLMAVLYHLGVMQVLIRGIAWLMQRTMRTSGAETLSTAANIFVGQTEAPLLVRPFVATMTKSELLVVMAGGMANTAGGVLAAYVGMLYTFFPDIAGHLLAESIMSAPAALVTSKMIWPEDGEPVTRDGAKLEIPKIDANAIEAAARGASEGLALAFNVAAMLIAFIALVAMLDGGLAAITGGLGLPVITFQKIAGWLFYPFAWVMGVPTEDCVFVGQLLGQKIVLNEFVAYGTLSTALTTGTVPISARAVLIASYALSGFANVGSIGIQIGGIGSLAPERRGDVARLGALAVVAGSIATFMTACIAAVLG
jgi:CNT family concentrative nucleoside transporter